MEYLLSLVIGFIIGSVPTEVIVSNIFRNNNQNKSDSNNIKETKTPESFDSIFSRIILFTLNFLKGTISILLVKNILEDQFIFSAITLNSVILGDCYSPWIKFRGGRGLTTAAGGILFIAPSLLLIWSLFWALSFLFKKNINFSNITASFLTAIITVTSADILNQEKWLTNPAASNDFEFGTIFLIIFVIILSKHYDSLKTYFHSEKKKLKDKL